MNVSVDNDKLYISRTTRNLGIMEPAWVVFAKGESCLKFGKPKLSRAFH